MSYADTNGISLYYEEHGTGDPLVLLHGGFGSVEMFSGVREGLADGRRVVAVDLQAHGRTADADRPLRIETLADDIAGLIEQLGGTADVLGYSLGGDVAVRLAIQHPARVRKLVVVSAACRRDGNFPEVLTVFDQMSPAFADVLRQTPVWALYERVAPRPEDFDSLVAKSAELLKRDYDWSDEVAGITARTLLVFADADSIKPAHITEFAGLLGIGHRDAGYDGSARPANQLAILPGATHYDILASPLFLPVVNGFLDGGGGR
jgi:pimeloyl-ACP methyl ester carboxylesterase